MEGELWRQRKLPGGRSRAALSQLHTQPFCSLRPNPSPHTLHSRLTLTCPGPGRRATQLSRRCQAPGGIEEVVGGRRCGKAPGVGRDRSAPSKHGEVLPAVPLPAPPMTRARAAQKGGQCQHSGQWSYLEQNSCHCNEQTYSLRLQVRLLIPRDHLPLPARS